MIPGDELDVLKSDKTNDAKVVPEHEHVVGKFFFAGSESFNILQKVVFFGVIIGVVVGFLRMRSRNAVRHQQYPV
jgi:hypothetical protein